MPAKLQDFWKLPQRGANKAPRKGKKFLKLRINKCVVFALALKVI